LTALYPDKTTLIELLYPYRRGVIYYSTNPPLDEFNGDAKLWEAYRVELEAYHNWFYDLLQGLYNNTNLFEKLATLYVYSQISKGRKALRRENVQVSKWADDAAIRVAATRARDTKYHTL
jgi:hypothetical protein